MHKNCWVLSMMKKFWHAEEIFLKNKINVKLIGFLKCSKKMKYSFNNFCLFFGPCAIVYHPLWLTLEAVKHIVGKSSRSSIDPPGPVTQFRWKTALMKITKQQIISRASVLSAYFWALPWSHFLLHASECRWVVQVWLHCVAFDLGKQGADCWVTPWNWAAPWASWSCAYPPPACV